MVEVHAWRSIINQILSDKCWVLLSNFMEANPLSRVGVIRVGIQKVATLLKGLVRKHGPMYGLRWREVNLELSSSNPSIFNWELSCSHHRLLTQWHMWLEYFNLPSIFLVTSHHYTSSTLIVGKGGAGPSSLHTMLERPMEYVNARWM